jgi:hypothetical protein
MSPPRQSRFPPQILARVAARQHNHAIEENAPTNRVRNAAARADEDTRYSEPADACVGASANSAGKRFGEARDRGGIFGDTSQSSDVPVLLPSTSHRKARSPTMRLKPGREIWHGSGQIIPSIRVRLSAAKRPSAQRANRGGHPRLSGVFIRPRRSRVAYSSPNPIV